jgi:MFS family permease
MAYIFGGLGPKIASDSAVSSLPLLSGFKPWQITFFITALPGLLIIALMFTVREPLRRERLKVEASGLSMREAVVYVRQHFRLYFAMLVGNSFIALANYALFAWLPAYFIRVYGYTPSRIGATFGTILLVFGTAGLMLGGMLADGRFRRGHLAAHYNLTIGLTAMGIVPAILIMGGGSEFLQLALVAALVLFASVSTGLIPAATQLVTPNELRGQMTALYLMLTAIVGLGLGPTLVALLVDFYFEDTMAVGKAMSLVISTSLAIAVLLMLTGKSVYRRRQQSIQEGAM